MKIKIDDCYYELIKELLLSQESKILDVKKDDQGAIVTMKDGYTKMDLIDILNQEPLFQFCKNAAIYIV